MSSKFISISLGTFCIGLGIVGAFLPVLPSTCFFIFGAYFFSKSSPTLESWILNHPKFGYAVRSWRETRSIPRAGKIAAASGMSLSAVLLAASPAALYLKLIAFLFLALSLIYVLTRPTLAAQPNKYQQILN